MTAISPARAADVPALQTRSDAPPRRRRAKGKPAPRLDGRTRQARAAAALRADLVKHCGGSPSPTQAALISLAIRLSTHIHDMDERFLREGSLSEHAAKQYLAWANSYRRTVRELGVKPAEPAQRRVPTVEEIMAGIVVV